VIIILAVSGLFDYKGFMDVWKVNKLDTLPFAISFWGSLILDIQYGVVAAVGVNMLILLYYAARPKHIVLKSDEQGQIVPAKIERHVPFTTSPPGVAILQLTGDLVFAAMNDLEESIDKLMETTRATVLVLELSNVMHIDYTGVVGVRDVVGKLQGSKIVIYMACVKEEIQAMLERGNVLKHIVVCPNLTAAVSAASADVLEKESIVSPRVGGQNPMVVVNPSTQVDESEQDGVKNYEHKNGPRELLLNDLPTNSGSRWSMSGARYGAFDN